MSPPPTTGPTGTTPSGPDTTTATEFLNDLMLATTGLMQDQLTRWSGIFQQMRQGTYRASQLQMDLARMLDPLITLAAFPIQWWTQSSKQLPTMLFIVDEVAETVGPFDTPLNISLPPGVTPAVSELLQIGGNRKFDASHIQVRLSPEGNQLSVTLVDLGSGRAARAAKGLEPGLYIGPVYATEVATRRPLALVYVLIEQPAGP